jgi:hypothetical protein
MDMERFRLKKLNGGDVKEQCQVTAINKTAALENLEGNGEISRARKPIRENKNFVQKASRFL